MTLLDFVLEIKKKKHWYRNTIKYYLNLQTIRSLKSYAWIKEKKIYLFIGIWFWNCIIYYIVFK